MSKSYNFICNTANMKFIIKEKFYQNKLFIFSLIFMAFVGLLTGVLVALKCGVGVSTLNDYNLQIYVCGEANSFSNLITRVVSVFCNMLIILISSLSLIIAPIGFIIITYKTYLVGFNCTLLFSLYGFSGAITSILVVLPCQIIMVIGLIVFFVLSVNGSMNKKRFCEKPKRLKLFLIFFIVLILICIIETLLLTIFNAKMIFVL